VELEKGERAEPIPLTPKKVAQVLEKSKLQRSGSASARRHTLNRLLADRYFTTPTDASKRSLLRSGEGETVKVHDFVPRRYKVVQEFLR
jgi:hypothetical protein